MSAKPKKAARERKPDGIAAKVKSLVDQTMGAGMRKPDKKAGKALLDLVEKAERDGDKRVFAALAKPGVNEILFWAAEEGQAGLVKALLNAGVSPKLATMGMRPINSAVKGGNSAVIELLLKAGEDPSYSGFFGKPIAIQAAEEKHLQAVKTLVRLGADVNARDETGGQTALIAIAPNADAEIVRQIVEKGADPNTTDDDGLTALMRAAGAGNLEAVKELIRLGADINWASRLRPVKEIAKERPDAPVAFKGRGKFRAARQDPLGTALMVAAQNGHAHVVEWLVQAGADPNARDSSGETALDFAEANGHATVLRVLRGGRAGGVPEIGIRDLLRAVEEADIEGVRATLSAGVDVNAKISVRYAGDIKDGLTPLGGKPAIVLAVERGDIPMVKALLAANANPNLCAELTIFGNGQNALHVAAQNGNVELVRLLLKAGAKTNIREAGTRDAPGQLPLQLATKNGHEQVVEELLKASTQTSGGRTKAPAGLHEAASTGNERLVARFLQKGAGLEDLSTEEECTPLMLAAFNAYPEVVRQLLDAGAEINTANGHRQTALTMAVHGAWVRSDWGWRERRFDEALRTLKLLIDRGANLNAKTHEGESALEMAEVSRLKTIAALLRKAGAK